LDLAELLEGAAFFAGEAGEGPVEEFDGVAAGVFVGCFGVGLVFYGFGVVSVGDADGPVLSGGGLGYGFYEHEFDGGGGVVLGDQVGEEPLAVGFAGVVGREVFGAEAVFAGVGGGFAFAFGGDRAAGEFTVGLSGEGELGGCHLVEFLFPGIIVAWGCASRRGDLGLSRLFSGERFLKIVVNGFSGELERQKPNSRFDPVSHR
jgi:hypothetical protein